MRRLALAAVAALVLAQGLAAARVELTFDEAYYALWARWPQAGYYDHPPLVAWIVAASQALFGRSEFGARALFWLMGACLPGLVYSLGLRLYDEATALAATLVLVGAPLMAGAPLATPDTPLSFFWTLALVGFVEVWRGRRGAWALVGLATGLAGLAKLTAGFLGLGIALALIAVPSLRAEWRRPWPYAAAALAAAVVSPFLAWNATHGYATFLKQGGRIAAQSFAPRYLAEFAGAQAALFNPLSAAAALYGAARRRGGGCEPTRLLLATVAPALAYFLLHALHDRVQGNWPAPLYPALALLAARATLGWRWPAPAAAASGLATIVAAYLHLTTHWPDFGAADPFLRIGGWRALAAEVCEIAQARDAGFVLAEGYAATSLLSFYSASTPIVEAGEPQRWTFRPAVDARGPGLAFGRPRFAAELSRRFVSVTPLATLRRRVGGVELESYEVFAVDGARP